MKPKEKAKALFDKYFLLHESSTDENGVWIVSALNKGLAKQCALIAVDEILSINNERWYQLTGSKENYYKEVKTEIEKL